MLIRPALPSPSLVARISLVLTCTVLLSPTSAITKADQSRISTDNALPSGLVVVLENNPDRALDLGPLSNPSISGVALQIHWSDIEPVEGKPDWTKLDQLFAAAESSKKWVQLLIFPGFFFFVRYGLSLPLALVAGKYLEGIEP